MSEIPAGSNEDEEFALIMPFLLVKSKGGPYDDEAFVSGYRMGLLDGDLRSGRAEGRAIQTTEYEQADLIAMRYGYTMTTTPPPAELFATAPWMWAEFGFDDKREGS